MKKLIASIVSSAVILSVSQGAQAFTPESKQPIKLMVADWTSMLINTEIMNIILSTYGYNVEKVIADDSARYPGFEYGDLHIALETWQTTQEAALASSIKTGKVLDLGETGMHAKEDWWYPLYMKERCPGLPEWKALQDCAAAFATADTAPKGRYLSAPVSWGGNDEERVAALDLPFEVVHAGTDAGLTAELKAAYERKAPIILWVYEPNWVSKAFEGEFVKFPANTPECTSDASWGPNKDATYDCGKPEGWIKKMGWAEGETIWPCAYDMVRNFKMDNATISDLVYQVDVEGKEVEDVAMQWARDNEKTWRSWASCAAN
ncbi:ABC transporter substrate-binding protein [Amphritea pacifica]|uniref:ABC transporter substrate-binding protein n=1 Tax=Amphritea pacifica TaxID=2811233 RepID=A0ABS2W7X2_9GAMM|nr:ABC transporter substrate-binding protein [Amphritea pacifica]MBN0987805.1 ABC transporter substrate-binding protein [Amphritea pacifica]MBN1008082.1 ABC transporter substrate-binding protein [Amphritea pacifica]